MDTSMLESLSRIEHQVKSSRNVTKRHNSKKFHCMLKQKLTCSCSKRPHAKLQRDNCSTMKMRHHLHLFKIQISFDIASKVSSIRKRLLDEKDKDILNLHSKNNALRAKIKSLDALKKELEKEKKKTKTLQADLDRTRAEVIGQARSGEEAAVTTTELRAEVSELEKSCQS